MRRLAFLALALSSALALTGAGQPPPPRQITFNAEQQAALVKVNDYLNAIRSLKSNFVQLGPEGQLDQGILYISKPGQLRFQYNAPSPILIVATGGRIYLRNARLNTLDNYSLSDTPLGLLLEENVNFMRNKSVMGVGQQPDALIVRARTSPNRNQSNITLVFSWPNVELRQWTVRDNQGGTTTVALAGTLTGVPMDAALFAVPVKAPPVRKGG